MNVAMNEVKARAQTWYSAQSVCGAIAFALMTVTTAICTDNAVAATCPANLGPRETPTAEFVVNAKGDVHLDTFNVVMTTHPAFVDAVRLALKDQQFFPAIRKGQPVQQVVQLPFTFVPDSGAVRRR